MNKKQNGKYKLEVDWNGRRHIEWYTDKSRAILRKDVLDHYRDSDCPDFSPFSNIKITFVEADKLPFK